MTRPDVNGHGWSACFDWGESDACEINKIIDITAVTAATTTAATAIAVETTATTTATATATRAGR